VTFRETIKSYYILTKPGIVRGNVMAGAAGYLLASGRSLDLNALIGLIVGMSLVIGSSCVVNNYLDRKIDTKMQRTQKRPLVTGEISTKNAITYGIILGIIGFSVLLATTYWLTSMLGLVGVIFYVAVYGYAKRQSKWGTLVGSISGAIPPVAGYVAGAGTLDLTAGLLFLILAVWQMPHFYAIALFRKADYAKAGIPVWSITDGNASTKRQIIGFIVLFILTSLTLSVIGPAGLVYSLLITIMGIWWLIYAMKGLRTDDDIKWARGVFGCSLLVLLVFCALISVDAFLP
jgi:protoheme IX farnesyltransferase